MQVITTEHNIYEVLRPHQERILNSFIAHRKTITISIAMISAVLIGGYILSNISLPNTSMGSIFDPLPVYKNGLGAINGYAFSEAGLPLTETIMIAAEQGGLSKTTSLSLTPEGKYVFANLNPGKYVIVAAFPDGIYRVLNNVNVEPNSVQTFIFKY